jgi:MFS family permease
VLVFGYTEPIMMGIMLNMVSPPERSTAISVTTFLMMSFGLLPAPYVYGAIYNHYTELDCPPNPPVTSTNIITFLGTFEPAKEEECHTVMAMRYVSFVTVIGGVALFLSFFFRRVSQQAGAERVKERLHEKKDYHNLSSE